MILSQKESQVLFYSSGAERSEALFSDIPYSFLVQEGAKECKSVQEGAGGWKTVRRCSSLVQDGARKCNSVQEGAEVCERV